MSKLTVIIKTLCQNSQLLLKLHVKIQLLLNNNNVTKFNNKNNIVIVKTLCLISMLHYTVLSSNKW